MVKFQAKLSSPEVYNFTKRKYPNSCISVRVCGTHVHGSFCAQVAVLSIEVEAHTTFKCPAQLQWFLSCLAPDLEGTVIATITTILTSIFHGNVLLCWKTNL